MPATNQSTLISIFGDIATAIRGKLNSQATYQPDDMAAAIASIPTGSSSGLNVAVSAVGVDIDNITLVVENNTVENLSTIGSFISKATIEN